MSQDKRKESTIIPLPEILRLKELLTRGRINFDHLEIIQRFDTTDDIKHVLFNREPFLMICKAVVFSDEVKGVKHLRVIAQTEITNEQCQGHYPGYPIFPIALIAEIIGQTGCLLLSVTKKDSFKDAIPLAVKSKEFRSGNSGVISPGDSLITVAEHIRSKKGFAQITAAVISGEKIVATMDELSYMAAKLPLKNTDNIYKSPAVKDMVKEYAG